MLEESIPSIWASMYSWFTPTVLFILLNLMIGTIAVTSCLGTQKNQNQTKEGKQPQLTRPPSVLERLKSINLYRYRSEEINSFQSVTTTLQPPEPVTYQTVEQPAQEEVEEEEEETLDHPDHKVTRTKSDTKPTSGDLPVKLPQKMKKSASSQSAFSHFEEEEIVERTGPSTVKEGKSRASELQHFGEDDEVDAKADDFINRFKEQLKLQRHDSIIRYQEMLSRGAKQ